MAEGILRHLSEGTVDVYSAGTRPRGVNPLAIKALEPTIDISHQRSKHLDEFIHERFDYVITLCDRAREECPIFPGHPERIHWSFPDPAEVEGEKEREAAFRRTAKRALHSASLSHGADRKEAQRPSKTLAGQVQGLDRWRRAKKESPAAM